MVLEQEWQDEYPSTRGEPEFIVPYMQSSSQVPIMTNSESIMQFGPNAYSKPATALNILRETILGRSLFDFSFKEYARRWKFKRPMPADFFRTMEDASGIDLDWFWRGWFYTTDHCDIAISKVELFVVDRNSPDENAELAKQKKAARRPSLSKQRNEPLEKRANQFPELKDFYNEYDPLEVTEDQRKAFEKFKSELSDKEKELLEKTDRYYRVSFKNEGGLVMPIILIATFDDGSTREIRIPAEIWRLDNLQCDTLIVADKPIQSIELDPYRETADINRDNNHFPPQLEPSRFQLYKARLGTGEDNPMQKAKKAEAAKLEAEKAEADQKEKEAAEAKAKADTQATTDTPSVDSKEPSIKSDDAPTTQPAKLMDPAATPSDTEPQIEGKPKTDEASSKEESKDDRDERRRKKHKKHKKHADGSSSD
jgi:hypothetical protein